MLLNIRINREKGNFRRKTFNCGEIATCLRFIVSEKLSVKVEISHDLWPCLSQQNESEKAWAWMLLVRFYSATLGWLWHWVVDVVDLLAPWWSAKSPSSEIYRSAGRKISRNHEHRFPHQHQSFFHVDAIVTWKFQLLQPRASVSILNMQSKLITFSRKTIKSFPPSQAHLSFPQRCFLMIQKIFLFIQQ